MTMKGISCILATAAALSLSPLPASAQPATRSFGRVEVAFLVGQSYPSIIVDEPGIVRSPPTARDTGGTYNLFVQDVSARLWWTRRLSTAVSFGWSTDGSHTDTFPRPASLPFPFTAYVSQRTATYHSSLWSISQAVDLKTAGRIVPFVGGGVEFRSVTRRNETTDVSVVDPATFSGAVEYNGNQVAAFLTAGTRVALGAHFSLLVDGSWYGGLSESGVVPNGGLFFSNQKTADTLLGANTWRWRTGVGVRF